VDLDQARIASRQGIIVPRWLRICLLLRFDHAVALAGMAGLDPAGTP
jgi:hypothetical protein